MPTYITNAAGYPVTVTSASKPASSSSQSKIWGSPFVIVVVGSLIAIWLGGTRFAPVVIAALIGVLIYWVLYPSP